MFCVLLCAGVDNPLELELQENEFLRGIPRALLPVAGKPMLSYWWESIMSTREIQTIYLVCNAKSYKHFERWATAQGIPTTNVINNGATSPQNSLGAARDLHLALRRAKANGSQIREALVIAGDSLFFREFDLPQIITCYRHLQKREINPKDCSDVGSPRGKGHTSSVCAGTTSLVLYYKISEYDDPSRRGIVEIDPSTKLVVNFQEKPKDLSKAKSRMACPLFYILGEESLALLQDASANIAPGKSLSCGMFLQETFNQTNYYGLRLPGAFNLVGNSAGIDEYEELNLRFGGGKLSAATTHIEGSALSVESALAEEVQSKMLARSYISDMHTLPKSCHGTAYARVGILGNPSDGFFGKTLAVTISNFQADVWISESPTLRIEPHPLFDPTEFGSLADLHSNCLRDGYFGGLRLLLGTCKKFFEFAFEHGIVLPKRNFTVKYDTNIPRQVGLSGSSAIVTALFRALMDFYGLTEDDIPKPTQPNFVLSVEMEEMGIQAGLQDRVVQCYEGLVWMDFNRELMSHRGYGDYEKLSVSSLPKNLFIAYRAEPSESGKIHSNVKQRWLSGDEEVKAAMERFASFAADGKEALMKGDLENFGCLMNKNFDLRRELYSDAVVGHSNIEMIEIARAHGAFAKFPGSGGAILGFAPEKVDLAALRLAYEDVGCVFCFIDPIES